MNNTKIKVLIVDDSVLFRQTLSKFLSADTNIEIVGTAADPYEARDMILQFRPDVVTLDVEMPRMSGITFLQKLIPQCPVPVVVVTSLPVSAFDALDAGAVDFVKKPVVKGPQDIYDFCAKLSIKIRAAFNAKVTRASNRTEMFKNNRTFDKMSVANKDMVIALGASTGGTDALLMVVQNLPEDTPPVLIVQHMPQGFTKMYSERLNRSCKMEVREAKNGDRLENGLILVAEGSYHMTLQKDNRGYYVKCEQGEKVSGHCPSVDVLFSSVAKTAKENAIGAILTGMGSDGANGLLEMKKAGAYTIGQDKDSCVVYGMPMVAYKIGAVTEQCPLKDISTLIYNKLSKAD